MQYTLYLFASYVSYLKQTDQLVSFSIPISVSQFLFIPHPHIRRMGQAITNLGRSEEEKKADEIVAMIDQCYDNFFADTTKIHNLADFYHAICQTIEEINTLLGNTQFRIPSTKTLEKVFQGEHKDKESSQHFTKDEFVKILLHVIFETGVTGTKAKQILLLMFGFLGIFQEHHATERNEKSLPKEGFRNIFQDANSDTRLARGAMDILFFIFGVPITALFFKQRVFPIPVPDEVFIPGVTSATVFFLAKLKKI